MWLKGDSNPQVPFGTADFKSAAYTNFAIKPNAIFVPSIATCCYLHRWYCRIIHLLYADSEKSLFKNEIELIKNEDFSTSRLPFLTIFIDFPLKIIFGLNNNIVIGRGVEPLYNHSDTPELTGSTRPIRTVGHPFSQ